MEEDWEAEEEEKKVVYSHENLGGVMQKDHKKC